MPTCAISSPLIASQRESRPGRRKHRRWPPGSPPPRPTPSPKSTCHFARQGEMRQLKSPTRWRVDRGPGATHCGTDELQTGENRPLGPLTVGNHDGVVGPRVGNEADRIAAASPKSIDRQRFPTPQPACRPSRSNRQTPGRSDRRAVFAVVREHPQRGGSARSTSTRTKPSRPAIRRPGASRWMSPGRCRRPAPLFCLSRLLEMARRDQGLLDARFSSPTNASWRPSLAADGSMRGERRESLDRVVPLGLP